LRHLTASIQRRVLSLRRDVLLLASLALVVIVAQTASGPYDSDLA
jgi:hypothetical protein